MGGGRTRARCEGRVELRIRRASFLFYLGVGVFIAAQGDDALGTLAEDANYLNGTYRLLLAALAQARVVGQVTFVAAVALVLLVVGAALAKCLLLDLDVLDVVLGRLGRKHVRLTRHGLLVVVVEALELPFIAVEAAHLLVSHILGGTTVRPRGALVLPRAERALRHARLNFL